MNEKASHDEIGRQSTHSLTNQKQLTQECLVWHLEAPWCFWRGIPCHLPCFMLGSALIKPHYITMQWEGCFVPWLWCLFQHCYNCYIKQFTISHKCTTNQYWLEWINSSSPAWLTVGITQWSHKILQKQKYTGNQELSYFNCRSRPKRLRCTGN